MKNFACAADWHAACYLHLSETSRTNRKLLRIELLKVRMKKMKSKTQNLPARALMLALAMFLVLPALAFAGRREVKATSVFRRRAGRSLEHN